jgi:hypothetical protein
MRRWRRVATLGGALAALVACGPAAAPPSDHPTGVTVARVGDACRALTPEEVGEIAGAEAIRLTEDFALRSAYATGHECVYENDAQRNLRTDGGYFLLVLTVEHDPTAKLYLDYRDSAKDATTTPFGTDEGFSTANRIGVRHGVWCVLATKGITGKDDAYREIVRRFASRLPLIRVTKAA